MVSGSDPAQTPDQARLPAGLAKQTWFQHLQEQALALEGETKFKLRWDLIVYYFSLGNLILENSHNFERHKIYGEEIIKQIALAVGKSERLVYYATQFVKKYPSLDQVPEGKAISWTKLKQFYLTDQKNLHGRAESSELCPYCKRPMPVDKTNQINHNKA